MAKGMVREEPVRARRGGGRRRMGRVERAREDDAVDDHDLAGGFEREESFRSSRGERGERARRRPRNDIRDDLTDLQKGVMYAGVESAAATLDVMTHVLRNAVDRAFSNDYRDPGDAVRHLGRDVSSMGRDTLHELEDVPRRMADGFYDAVPRRQRQDRGERHRRAQGTVEPDES